VWIDTHISRKAAITLINWQYEAEIVLFCTYSFFRSTQMIRNDLLDLFLLLPLYRYLLFMIYYCITSIRKAVKGIEPAAHVGSQGL